MQQPISRTSMAFLAVVAAFALQSEASVADSVRAAKFLGDRAGAISYTFDDGMRDQAEHYVPRLDKFGIKGTFWIVTGWTEETDAAAAGVTADRMGGMSWQTLVRMHANGHEIGNHSWDHPYTLLNVDNAGLNKQIDSAFAKIATKIGTPPFSFCYPFNTWDDRVRARVLRQHRADRTFCTGVGGAATAASLNAMARGAITQKSWVVTMSHGFTVGYDAFADTSVFSAHLAYVVTKTDSLWIATFGTVSRYVKERDSSTVTAVMTGATALSVTMATQLDTSAFDQPLTLVVPTGPVVSATAHYQGSSANLPVTIQAQRILVDAMPSRAVVQVSWVPRMSAIARDTAPSTRAPATRTSAPPPNRAFDAAGRCITSQTNPKARPDIQPNRVPVTK